MDINCIPVCVAIFLGRNMMMTHAKLHLVCHFPFMLHGFLPVDTNAMRCSFWETGEHTSNLRNLCAPRGIN